MDVQGLVQDAIDELVGSGAERGVQVAVYKNGTQIVDAVAGPVAPATPIYTYSMGKGMTATVAHILVERGLFGYETPIAELWPEFAAHGKGAATIRHALTHTVGVPAVPRDTTVADVCDWDRICAMIADSELWWEPGTKTGYHAYTFGYIVGEVVRRATGKPISQVLREEIGEPLGVAEELYFGMPASEQARLAPLEEAPGAAEMLASIPDDSPFFATAPRALLPTAEFGNRSDVLAADIPAGGKMTARAAALMYAALMGDVDGVRLIPPGRLREVSAVAFAGKDELMGNDARWALGYAIGRPGGDPRRTMSVIGMGGAGGTIGYADTATGVAFALCKNRLTPDFSTSERIGEIVARATA